MGKSMSWKQMKAVGHSKAAAMERTFRFSSESSEHAMRAELEQITRGVMVIKLASRRPSNRSPQSFQGR